LDDKLAKKAARTIKVGLPWGNKNILGRVSWFIENIMYLCTMNDSWYWTVKDLVQQITKLYGNAKKNKSVRFIKKIKHNYIYIKIKMKTFNNIFGFEFFAFEAEDDCMRNPKDMLWT
jgi:hypothetical protein